MRTACSPLRAGAQGSTHKGQPPLTAIPFADGAGARRREAACAWSARAPLPAGAVGSGSASHCVDAVGREAEPWQRHCATACMRARGDAHTACQCLWPACMHALLPGRAACVIYLPPLPPLAPHCCAERARVVMVVMLAPHAFLTPRLVLLVPPGHLVGAAAVGAARLRTQPSRSCPRVCGQLRRSPAGLCGAAALPLNQRQQPQAICGSLACWDRQVRAPEPCPYVRTMRPGRRAGRAPGRRPRRTQPSRRTHAGRP